MSYFSFNYCFSLYNLGTLLLLTIFFLELLKNYTLRVSCSGVVLLPTLLASQLSAVILDLLWAVVEGLLERVSLVTSSDSSLASFAAVT